MALLFNASTTRVDATLLTGLGTSDWTIGCYVFPLSAGQSNNGAMISLETATPAVRQRLRIAASTLTVVSAQVFSTTNSSATTSTSLPTSAWSCVIGTYRSSDKKSRVFLGDPLTPMAEAPYTTQNAGVGTNSGGAVNAHFGAATDATQAFDGRLARIVIVGREWSLAEMEFYRRTGFPPSFLQLRGYWPFYGTAATARDFSGQGQDGTLVNGPVAAVDPVLWRPRSARNKRVA